MGDKIVWKAAVMKRRKVEQVFDLFLEAGETPPEDLENYPNVPGVLNLVQYDANKYKAIYRRSNDRN
jgi:hypothetical protein